MSLTISLIQLLGTLSTNLFKLSFRTPSHADFIAFQVQPYFLQMASPDRKALSLEFPTGSRTSSGQHSVLAIVIILSRNFGTTFL